MVTLHSVIVEKKLKVLDSGKQVIGKSIYMVNHIILGNKKIINEL